jgi:hypothetical protein
MKITSTIPDHLRDRAWYNETSAYAFLVHAPITFGHSQLIVSLPPCIHEEDAFSLAAKHITICIARLRLTFVNLDLEEWGTLAQYTVTSGQYVKTLVLKVSANENQGEYKIHLVPCFSSHIEAANDLFWARLGKKQARGGLLYWIGRREDLVDHDTSPLDAVAEERIKSFCLTGLSATLRCPTKPGTV